MKPMTRMAQYGASPSPCFALSGTSAMYAQINLPLHIYCMHFHPPENRKKMRISGSSAVLVALLALATVVVGQFYVRPLPRLQLQVHCVC
jgi:ABC-type phosphate transport system permease subunit